MKKQSTDDTAQPVLQHDPDEWKTGDEPMTDAQRSYLETFCREARLRSSARFTSFGEASG